MGRAIAMENTLEALDRRLKLVEDALEELVQTRVHHVDLTDMGVDVTPDKEFTAPVDTTKKRRRAKATT